MYVVEYDGHSVAWGFSQADVPRDHAFEYLGAEEAAEIRGNLL
jgi:hypothetical protein